MCKQTSVLYSKRWHSGFVPTQVSFVPSFLFLVVGSHHWQWYSTRPWKKVLFKGELTPFILISSSALESTADPQVLHLTAQTQWRQLHHYFHAPAERQRSPKMGSALPVLRATFQNWVPPVNLRFMALIFMLMVSESTGLMHETQICDPVGTKGQGIERSCHTAGNYKAFTKGAGKINSGPSGEYRQSSTTLLFTYLALSFNDYDRHRSGRPAVFGWEGFITIP